MTLLCSSKVGSDIGLYSDFDHHSSPWWGNSYRCVDSTLMSSYALNRSANVARYIILPHVKSKTVFVPDIYVSSGNETLTFISSVFVPDCQMQICQKNFFFRKNISVHFFMRKRTLQKHAGTLCSLFFHQNIVFLIVAFAAIWSLKSVK